MKIFSEVYSCYYSVVGEILRSCPLSKQQIEDVIRELGFSESVLFLPPLLFNDWKLLTQNSDKTYRSNLECKPYLPVTKLERSWLKALLSDSRFRLFFSEDALTQLETELSNVEPLYHSDNFHYFDRFSNGDDYTDPKYKANFQNILRAIHNREVLNIAYATDVSEFNGVYQPLSIEYSIKNDKFRLLTAKLSKKGKCKYYVLNLSKVDDVKVSNVPWDDGVTIQEYFQARRCPQNEPITVEVLDERNSIERFMMEFATYEKQTEYVSKGGKIVSSIWYDTCDETELLVRLLSFGATLEILSPLRIRDEAKRRIFEQYRLFNS